MKKFLSVIISMMIVLASSPHFGLIENVEAAQKNVCEETADGNYCVESEDASFSENGGCLEGRKRTGQDLDRLSDENGGACQIGTCVPQDGGQCLTSKTKIECEQEGGEFFAEDEDNVPQCDQVCCVTSSQCGVVERNFCDFKDGVSHAGITTNNECNIQFCAAQTVGCFKPSNSPKCEFGIRENVDNSNGDFHENTICRNVVGCETYNDDEDETYVSCGESQNGEGVTNDDGKNVYRFDKEGNRELEPVETCDPEMKCVDPDGPVIDSEDATCVSTSCVISEPKFYPNQFRSGESLCVNVLSGHFANDRISKGLENFKITCQNGEIEVDYSLGQDREFRCEESYDTENDNRVTANFADNEYEDCSSCGEGGTFGDIFGYVPIVGPPLASLFSSGKICGGGRWPPGQQTCNEVGDCGAGPLSKADYDGDFLWDPVGSCNPEYPPGNSDKCGECGGGGDRVLNQCTKAECNALGDCKFEGGNAAERYATTGAIALGTMGALGLFCKAIPFGGDIACGTSVGAGFVNLGTPLFWGAMGIVYGLGAAGNTIGEDEESEVIKELYKDDNRENKPRLIASLIVGKSLENIATSEIEDELESEQADIVDAWLVSTGPASLATALAVNPSLFGEFFSETIRGFFYHRGGVVPYASTASTVAGTIAQAVGITMSYVAVAESFETGTCVAETGYDNSKECGNCGPGEGQWYCTAERCAALGGGTLVDSRTIQEGHCQYVPFEQEGEGIEDGRCIASSPDDRNPPFIKNIKVEFKDEEGNIIQRFNGNGKQLVINDLISQEVTEVSANLTMNELTSSCGFSRISNTNFESSDKNVFDYNARTVNQVATIPIINNDKVQGNTGDQVNFYFKCKDFLGNTIPENDDSNLLGFTMDKQPDWKAPEINYIDPNKVYFPEGTGEVNLNLIAYDPNGVSECKYSKDCGINSETFDPECVTNYEDMINLGSKRNVECTTVDATCQSFSTTLILDEGWKQALSLSSDDCLPEFDNICGTTAPNLDIYNLGFKCKDNQGNINDLPELWSILVVPGFDVDVLKPFDGQEVRNTTLDINVQTSTPTTCELLLDGDLDQNLTSLGLYGVEHKGTLNNLKGSHNGLTYNMEVQCEDIAGNEGTDTVSFTVYSDILEPELLRIWTSSNKLNILLDEAATCYYSNEERDFDLINDEEIIAQMSSSLDRKTHFTSINEEVYYIACTDDWDNVARFTVFP